MLSLKEWRAMQEEIGPAITTPAQQTEPDARDWEFYHTKIQGRAKQYLNWFVGEVEKKPLNLARKGFILQEVMDALGMNVSEVVRAVSNIKRALAKKAMLEKEASAKTTPTPAPTPTPQPASTPTANPSAATQSNTPTTT